MLSFLCVIIAQLRVTHDRGKNKTDSFDIQAFGVALSNTLQNNYSIDTSSAVTYTDLISINPTITIQLLSQNYSEVYDFVYEQDDNVIITNLSLIYFTDENGEPINL